MVVELPLTSYAKQRKGMANKWLGKLRLTTHNIIGIVTLVTIVGSCRSSHQIHTGKTSTIKQYDSVLTDKDGNDYSLGVLRDNNLWMTTNLRLNLPGSYCYNDTLKYCEQYGRLYTWESAQKGCASLGDEWRLPTKDEWQRLAGFYGEMLKDSSEARKRSYVALLITGNSQFNAVLGGGRTPEGQYARLEAHGFYWTISEHDSSTAWFANFAKGSQALYHQNDGEKTRAFSVRCVKSIQSSK